MFEDITIIIPTMGRIGNQITWDNLTNELKSRTFLLTTHGEYEEYCWEYEDKNIISTPPTIKGIAATRQYAVDKCDTPYLFLIDDDMVFFKRDEFLQLTKCEPEDLNTMFISMINDLNFDYTLVGLSARQGNNFHEDDYKLATRQMNFHGINVGQFIKDGYRFDGSEVMEDFNLVLSMLTKGEANKVYYNYCWNQKGSGTQGGCSVYRDEALQAKCANELKEKYPDYVTIVKKQSKTAWKGMEERTDVRIAWKKAYQDGSL